MNWHCAMDSKETAEKRKGEGKGPDVAHSLKLCLFVRLFSVHVLRDHINFTAIIAQLTGIYIQTQSRNITDKYCISVLCVDGTVSNTLCVFSTEQHKQDDN
jgi:hypothetical protein